MFVRRVKKSPKSVSVRIVENRRVDDGSVKQELIKVVGTGKTEEEIQILERAANEMILSLDPTTAKKTIKSINDIPDSVHMNSVREVKRVNDGILDVFGPFYDECGFGNIIDKTYKNAQWNEILKALVLARIVHP